MESGKVKAKRAAKAARLQQVIYVLFLRSNGGNERVNFQITPLEMPFPPLAS